MGYDPNDIRDNIAANSADAAELRSQAAEAKNPRIARILMEAAAALEQESVELEAEAAQAEADAQAEANAQAEADAQAQ